MPWSAIPPQRHVFRDVCMKWGLMLYMPVVLNRKRPTWLRKKSLGVEPLKLNEFLKVKGNAILDGGDAEMMAFAREHLRRPPKGTVSRCFASLRVDKKVFCKSKRIGKGNLPFVGVFRPQF